MNSEQICYHDNYRGGLAKGGKFDLPSSLPSGVEMPLAAEIIAVYVALIAVKPNYL